MAAASWKKTSSPDCAETIETIKDTSMLNQATRAPFGVHERTAALNIAPDEFRALGHELVDRIAAFLGDLPSLPVTSGETPGALRTLLPAGQLPNEGAEPAALLAGAADLLFQHSLFNGHPRFFGYITSSPAPLGMLADLLAAAVNANVGSFQLGPMATEIESQTVRWIAELLGYPSDCGGVLVSGGNMANFVALLAARTVHTDWDVRTRGVAGGGKRLRIYASSDTHTWLQKAADLAGLGTDAISWIPVDDEGRIAVHALRERIAADRQQGDTPFFVVGSAGTVGTGAVDPLPELAEVCREERLWFHVDGAYGGFAAALLDGESGVGVPADLRGIALADSIAVDPHKWLYTPLEAGCVLVRDAAALPATFSAHPTYYHFDQAVEGEPPPLNYYEYGPQNSRGFRALKVWLGLRQAGRAGVVQQIADDIQLAGALAQSIQSTPELELFTNRLSITTFRYVPAELPLHKAEADEYLNTLNTALLEQLQQGGEVFVSNAVIGETFLLRACIVNFHTTLADVEALTEIVVRAGREVDARLRLT
jgi:aromatic-L-amino-acid/L-tryptophan decarboxylase